MLKKIAIIGSLLLISACNPISKNDSSITANVLVPKCIGSQSRCEVSVDTATFSIKFSQHQVSDNIKTELPFFIELTQLPQKNSKQNAKQDINQSIINVSAYLEGKDMFMGKVPVFFQKMDNDSSYSAQSLLASCSEEQMIWRLWVTIEMTGKTKTFFVDFTSQRL